MSAELEFPRLRGVDAFPTELNGRAVICLRDPTGLSEQVACVPQELGLALGLMDGRNSLLDIQEAYMRQYGQLVYRDVLADLVARLEECALLDTARARALQVEVEAAFRAMAVRPAALAGKSYEADPDKLRATLGAFFASPEGPGERPPRAAGDGPLRGAIVPHIDLGRGGPCYAWGYQQVRDRCDADLFLVFGVAHAGLPGPFGVTRKNFETPLGTLRTDQAFVDHLVARCGPEILEGELAHRGEHSIEFQALFLRYLFGGRRQVQFVPILCGSFQALIAAGRSPADDPRVERFVAAAAEGIAARGGRTCVLAGADLAHVGPRFGDPRPLSPAALRGLAAADRAMLDFVARGDAGGFYDSVRREGDRRRICGLAPIYMTVRTAGAGRGTVLKYAQWPDPNAVVTFASVALD
jgi:AmmeMemoRadiSam system protein B